MTESVATAHPDHQAKPSWQGMIVLQQILLARMGVWEHRSCTPRPSLV
jgi:hypothetical protein